MLLLKALRDVRALGVGALLIIAIIATGSGTTAGIAQALHDVQTTRDQFYTNYALADLDVRLAAPVPLSELTGANVGVDATRLEARLIVSGVAALEGGDTAPAEIVGMQPDAKLNQLDVVDGSDLSGLGPDDVLVEADFAQFSGIAIGDHVSLDISGQTQRWRVAGLVRSPEYLLATSNPDYLIPQRGSLAVLFMGRSRLQEITGAQGKANDVVLDLASASAAPSPTLAAGLPATRIIPRSQQYSLKFTEADVRIFSLLAPVLGGVFAISGLILVMLSLLRLVQRQQRELGALLAIGYSRTAVALSVVLVAAILGLGGALVGIGVTAGISRVVSTQYATAVGFPGTVHQLEPASLLLCAAIAIGAALIAVSVPAYRVARLTPAAAMRGRSTAGVHLPHWMERGTRDWSTPWAYAGRSLARRPLLALATVVSVSAAIGLGAALNILAGSTGQATDAAFAGDSWTHSVTLATPMSEADLSQLIAGAGVDRAEPLVEGPVRIATDTGNTVDLRVVGVPSADDLMRLDVASGAAPQPGTIDLSEQTASNLGLRAGDPVTVQTTTGTTRLTFGGEIRTLASSNAYTTTDVAAQLLGTKDVSAVLVAADSSQADVLRASPAVARVASKAQVQKAVHDLVTELTGLIDTMLAISLAVGVLFLISSLSLAFLDRSDEFATLRAMGYGRRPLAKIVTIETVLQTAAACLLAVPAGLLLATPLVTRMGEAWFHIGLDATPSDFTVVAGGLVLALVPALLTVRRLQRLNISTTVRARLIG
jgi:putative ABC transport system permease protein